MPTFVYCVTCTQLQEQNMIRETLFDQRLRRKEPKVTLKSIQEVLQSLKQIG